MCESIHPEIEQLRAILAEDGSEVTGAQILALKSFVDEIGSLEEAALALELLDELDAAA